MASPAKKLPEAARRIEWASPEQKALFDAPPTPTLALGGFNSAKTSGAILKFLAIMSAFPGYRVGVLRKTFTDLIHTTIPTILQWVPPDEIARNADRGASIELKNGSAFVCHHLDRPDSATVLKGWEINGALVDQAEQIPERTFDLLHGRLGRWSGAKVPEGLVAAAGGIEAWPYKDREGRPVPPAYMVLTANPAEDGDPELHWLWRRFSPDSSEASKWEAQGYRQIVFDSRRNRFASEQNIGILLAQDEDYVARYVRGEWVRPKGSMFALDDRSILEPEPALVAKIKNTFALYRSMDHGDTAPTCVLWFGVDGEANVYCYREYHQGDTLLSQHRKAVAKLSEETYRQNIADPSIFYKTRNVTGFAGKAQRWSVADEWLDTTGLVGTYENKVCWTPGPNDEDVTRTRLKEYLRVDPERRHPVTGELGAPRLYFLRKTKDYPHGCDQVLRDVRSARRKRLGGPDDAPIFSDERDEEIPDHALDALRYFVGGRPGLPSVAGPTTRTTVILKDRRVLITAPGFKAAMERSEPRSRERSAWRSRGGGY